MIRRTGRCVCGLRLALHYGRGNRFLPCPEARDAHPRAKVAARPLRVLLCQMGATPGRAATFVTGLQGKVVGAILPGGVR